MVRTQRRDLSARQVSSDASSVFDQNGEDLTLTYVIRRVENIENILTVFEL